MIQKHLKRLIIRKIQYNFTNLSHTQELIDDFYLKKYENLIKNYYQFEHTDIISGCATSEGTLEYSQNKTSDEVHSDSFKIHYKNNLKISTLGIGSYIGSPDITDDTRLFGSIIDSVQSGGVNNIDTAINYRYMKSERTIGAALKFLFQTKSITREQIFIASKGGYIPADGDRGIMEDQLIQQLIDKNIIKSDDVIGGCHCMSPKFLEHQLNCSLSHLGVKTLDLYYLHNSSESQLPLIGKQAYIDKILKSFEFLEEKIQEGKIKNYGLATWVCFRAKPQEESIYLSLEEMIQLAKKVAGENHHFNYVQVPISLIMPEAFAQNWQIIQNREGKNEEISLLGAARINEMNVISSSPLMNGALIQVPLSTEQFLCQHLGAKHLQFIRSIPSEALKSTLIGQKTNRHTKQNLEVIRHRMLKPEEFWQSLKPIKRKQEPEDTIDVD